MIEYLKFWAAKLLVESSLPIILIFALCMLYLAMMCFTWIKQACCRHLEYRETPACDAICRNCNKNLGFIGTLREKRKHER